MTSRAWLLVAAGVLALGASACAESDDGGAATTAPSSTISELGAEQAGTSTTTELGAEQAGTSTTTEQAGTSTTTELMSSIPPMAEGVRYIDPIFGAIETIENVMYWPDASPIPELAHIGVSDLTMDIHLPAGDTEVGRPVIVAFEGAPGGWLVDDYVRRGYVVVVPEVRGRPSSPSARSFDATSQGMVDGAAAVRWLRSNADAYGLHREAIAATGYSGAGIVAAALAWGQHNAAAVTEVDLFGLVTVPVPGEVDFGNHLAEEPSEIAAVFPMAAWYPPELVDSGEPPAMFFNGTTDPTYPFDAVERICPAAAAVGVTCILRTLPAGHALPEGVLSVESAVFLYEQMLAPLGIVDPATLPVDTPEPGALSGPEPMHIVSPESRPETEAKDDPQLSGLSIAPDGVIYVFTNEAIAAIDPSGETSMVGLDGLPEGEPLPDEYIQIREYTSPRIIDIAVDGDGRLWAAGASYSSAEDESFGGTVHVDWFGDEVRQLNWIAVRDCDALPCSWEVKSPDDPALAAGELGNLAVGVDGSVAATLSSYDPELLVRFDGVQWTSLPLPSVIHVQSMAIGHDGVVWIAPIVLDEVVLNEVTPEPVTGHLMSIDGQTVTGHTTIDGLPGNEASAVAVAGDGTVWATASGGPAGSIASYDGATWTIHDLGDDVYGAAESFATGSDETLWALLPDHYARFDGDEWETWPATLQTWGDAEIAPDGTLWHTLGTVLVSFDGTDETMHPSPFPR